MTRREILQNALLLPAAIPRSSSTLQVICEDDCLSQESAAGFRSVLQPHAPRNLVVVCGAVDTVTALHLHRLALDGRWIIWEAPLRSCAIAPSADHLYVRYRWPHTTLTRSFSSMMPVRCQAAEVIAHYRDIPVAMKRRLGRGGIIYLGCMLGPNLRAQEMQAIQLVTAISSRTTCAGTSTKASTNT